MLTQPEYRASRCTRFRYRYSGCSRCADACPHDAVELSDEGIKISAEACQNCALCAAACPTEALLADNLPRIDLLKRTTKRPEVTFACAPSEFKGDEIVPCLGALDPAMLGYLASRGVAVTLAGTQHCAGCVHGERGEARLSLNLEAAESLRRVAGNDQWADISVPDESATVLTGKAGHSPSRRHLFRRFVGRGADQLTRPVSAGEAQPVPLKAIRFAAPFSTAGRELLQILFNTRATPTPLPAHTALLAAQVDIRPGCIACEACARACPTGALQIRESATAWQLGFEFTRCVGCGVCVEACQPRVLYFKDEMENLAKSPEPVTLHALGKQRCTRCDRFFISPAPEEICPTCEGDDADFASLFG